MHSKDNFAAYFADFLIYRRGFSSVIPHQAAQLAEAADLVLAKSSGGRLEIACIVDRQSKPETAFALSAFFTEKIADACVESGGSGDRAIGAVEIVIYEIGPAATSPGTTSRLRAYKTTGWFKKSRLAAYAIDPKSNAVWTNLTDQGRSGERSVIENLLRMPWQSFESPHVGRDAPAPDLEAETDSYWAAATHRPIFTCGLIGVLVSVFIAELWLGVSPTPSSLRPSPDTLVAMGGVVRDAVIERQQFWRLITAPFLHLDLFHLAMNSLTLVIIGWRFERMIGTAWIAVIFAVSAVGGSLLSLVLLAPNTVAVGASGGIVGILAAAFASSFHFPKGPTRSSLQVRSLQGLIPALIPVFNFGSGTRISIDYGAHFGGAIAGGMIGLALLRIWRPSALTPRFAQAAGAAAAVFFGMAALAIIPQSEVYRAMRLVPLLAQPWPENEQAMQVHSAQLIQRYPRDPRLLLHRASVRIRSGDVAGTENDLRAALVEKEILASLLHPTVEARIRTFLAAVLLDQNKREEAQAIGKPACGVETTPPLQAQLARMRVCE